jgi:hypothetical protein
MFSKEKHQTSQSAIGKRKFSMIEARGIDRTLSSQFERIVKKKVLS